jgi:hypothetical protein
MENSEKGISTETKIKASEMLKIANQAVFEARAKSRSLGIAMSFWLNGRVWYELPDGTITDQKPTPNP